jgi:hypothetical protein
MIEIRDGILLYSARPEAHEPIENALSRAGVYVRVARHPDRALSQFRKRPTLHSRVGSIATGPAEPRS